MNWTFKELFDHQVRARMRQGIFARISKLFRIFVICTIMVQFYNVAVVPTDSMVPAIQVNDLVLVNVRERTPERGDMVSFHSPIPDESATYVKRVIGLPGEFIEINHNTVYINGVPLDEPYVPEGMPLRYYPPTRIGDGEYFVMGDNRVNSLDSTYFGCIQGDSIKGTAVRILLPPGRFRSLK